MVLDEGENKKNKGDSSEPSNLGGLNPIHHHHHNHIHFHGNTIHDNRKQNNFLNWLGNLKLGGIMSPIVALVFSILLLILRELPMYDVISSVWDLIIIMIIGLLFLFIILWAITYSRRDREYKSKQFYFDENYFKE